MSIYIEGIPMPKDGEHPIWISLHSDGTAEYNANKGDGWQMTTALSIPPHGRLIDGDALAAKCDSPHWCVWLSDIDAAPAIIPAEEGES